VLLDPLSIAILLVLGVVAGFLAGLLGIGGGMMMVPFLTMILTNRDFPPDAVIKVAIATSLTTIVFTSVSSVRAHHRRGAVDWRLVRLLAPGIVIGSLAGAQIVGALPGRLIATFFAAFIGWSSLNMLRGRKASGPGVPPRGLPPRSGLFAVSGAIGLLSAFLGAGGGFITVPFLTRRGVAIQRAIATSAACGFPIAFAGTLGYVAAGWDVHLPDATFGYLYLPALAIITPASMLTAPLGARAAHALSVDRMKTLFALLLLALAAYMFRRALAPG